VRVDLVQCHEIHKRLEILSLSASREHAQRLGDRPRWIAQRKPEPDAARIDREDSQELRLPETSWILSEMRELNSCSQGRPNGDWLTRASTTFGRDWRNACAFDGLMPFRWPRMLLSRKTGVEKPEAWPFRVMCPSAATSMAS